MRIQDKSKLSTNLCDPEQRLSLPDWQTKISQVVTQAKQTKQNLSVTISQMQDLIIDYPDHAANTGLPVQAGDLERYLVDVLGFEMPREVFQCERALQGVPGSGARNGPDVAINPLYHQYTCVESNDPQVPYRCEGQTAGQFLSPNLFLGAVSHDEFDKANCTKVSEDPDFAKCIEDQWANKRPLYSPSVFEPNGRVENCQAYDERLHQECQKYK